MSTSKTPASEPRAGGRALWVAAAGERRRRGGAGDGGRQASPGRARARGSTPEHLEPGGTTQNQAEPPAGPRGTRPNHPRGRAEPGGTSPKHPPGHAEPRRTRPKHPPGHAEPRRNAKARVGKESCRYGTFPSPRRPVLARLALPRPPAPPVAPPHPGAQPAPDRVDLWLGKGRESGALPLVFVSDEDRPLTRPPAARGESSGPVSGAFWDVCWRSRPSSRGRSAGPEQPDVGVPRGRSGRCDGCGR